MTRIKRTTNIQPRPAWRRHLLRTLKNFEPMQPPTETEIADALAILKESRGRVRDQLDLEAFRILDETGR